MENLTIQKQKQMKLQKICKKPFEFLQQMEIRKLNKKFTNCSYNINIYKESCFQFIVQPIYFKSYLIRNDGQQFIYKVPFKSEFNNNIFSKKEMGRSFVTMSTGMKSYKLFVPDIKKIYKINRKKTPVLPNFEFSADTTPTNSHGKIELFVN